MASLNPGVLVKLLEDMNDSDENVTVERRSPLLQVRSIVPVMEEGGLWPNRGFYLKVSDLSHAMYVSLPHECDEMIFNNELQLGQYVHVQKLESAQPVPILRGVKLVPGGKHPCVGTPEDLGFTKDLIGLSLSDPDSKLEKRPKEKPRSLSASRTHRSVPGDVKDLRFCSTPVSPIHQPSENESSDVLKELTCISISCIDEDSDLENLNTPCFVKPKSVRRSWEGARAGLKERSGRPVAALETRSLVRSRSASVSPYFSRRCDGSDDHSSCKSTIKRKTSRGSEVISSSVKQRIGIPKEKQGIFRPVLPSIPISDRKWAETAVSWGSLPSNLVKLGKEVLQHRDAALAAAVEALQEACAVEKLIQCLSTYSELQSTKDNDPQLMVDGLLDLHEDLVQARLITQSLAKISPMKADNDAISPGSIKEALKLTVERKKCAASWIKAALTSDLSQSADPFKSTSDSEETISKSLVPRGRLFKPKGVGTVFKERKICEIQFGLATVKDSAGDWAKGSSLCVSSDLDNALQCECRKRFLIYVEEFLDGIMSNTISTESDSEIAGVMCRIKRVDNWLDAIMSKEGSLPKDGCKEDSMSEDEDIETCQRLRNKLYVVLLKHVERSAVALESMSTAS
ncbi:hypothetical protein IFM89_016702 [Coptis chinensis]|uniref:Uncharacterized protein n=1 Tax=Coptis chinensis TaxID=261450 RepID=A0A835IT94_9MAGN|nr:hypothetical protein IFM89_016702 [Coptis chinensis]